MHNQGRGGELPKGYRRCKYIEGKYGTNSGNKTYIKTDIIPHSIDYEEKIKIDLEIIEWKLFDVEYNNFEYTTTFFSCGTYLKDLYQLRNNDKGNPYDVKIFYFPFRSAGTAYEFNIYNKKIFDNFHIISDYKHTSFGTYYTFDRQYECAHVTNKPLDIYKGGGKFGVAKIYEGENLVFNAIPSLDQSGKPCMFDTVTKQPFYNQGTGEFGYELMDGTYVPPV